MSGGYRRNLGPAKKRISTLLGKAPPFLQENMQNMDLEGLLDFRRKIEVFKDKIENETSYIEEQVEKWEKYIQTLDAREQTGEDQLLETCSDGGNGYIVLLSSVRDLKPELQAKMNYILEKVTALTQLANPAPPVLQPNAIRPERETRYMKLKEGQLQTFSGDSSKWPEFWGAFQTAVHDNPVLATVQKFSYLKGSVLGKAAETIAGFPISEEYYEEAVALLTERFGNKNNQLSTLHKNWMDLPIASSKLDDLENLVYSAATIQRQLKCLGDDISGNALAVHQLHSKIPFGVVIELEKERKADENWTLDLLIGSLKRYVEIRKRVQDTHQKSKTDFVSEKQFNKPQSFSQRDHNFHSEARSSAEGSSAKAISKFPCIFCGSMHYPDDCETVKSVSDRKTKLSAEKRCFLCLKDGHMIGNCPIKNSQSCFHCKKSGNHHRALCPTKFGILRKSDLSTAPASSNKIDQSIVHLSSNGRHESTLMMSGQVALLLTASVTVRRPNSANFLQCRLILDPGSQRSYILDSVAESLDLPSKGNQNLLISTFAADQPQSMSSFEADLEIFTQKGEPQLISANVVSKLTGEMRRECLCDEDLDVLRTRFAKDLADVLPAKEEFFRPQILIGIDHYFEFCLSGENQQLPSGLQIVPSRLGLLIGGRTSNFHEEPNSDKGNALFASCYNISISFFQKSELVEKVKPPTENDSKMNLGYFWSLENMGIVDSPGKPEEDTILSDFEKNIVFEEGRYHVNWPWKVKNPELPTNFGLALGRARSLSKKLKLDNELHQKYIDIIEDQGRKGITEDITDCSQTKNLVHYLPHHPVLTPQKTTTKIRIVYDASAKTNAEENSLNDCLYSGPKLISDFFGMLLRFRIHKPVIISYVQKTFVQVGLMLVLAFLILGLFRCGDRFPTSADKSNIYKFQENTSLGWPVLLPQVQKVLKKCFFCRKIGGGPYQMPEFAPLPKDRLKPAPPFKFTGLDYFGPILIKSDGSPKKHWVCLFTCLVVRAVHLELLPDMSTSEFLSGFRRFVSRRGCPAVIISDNATQFRSANSIIGQTFQTIQNDPELSSYFAEKNIEWKFIPALSPWQGGIYERMVGTVKASLKRSLGRRLLFPNDLTTVLCEVESVVNSRPITYLSAEFPNHPALTPANFLLPCSQYDNIIPAFFPKNEEDEEYLPSQDHGFKRVADLWKKQQIVLDNFWELWSTEYLDMLKERKDFQHSHGKMCAHHPPTVGEIVLVSEPGMPRGKWKLGRIQKLNVSNDGEIRSVVVQLPSQMALTRPITHLYPLELSASLDDDTVVDNDNHNSVVDMKTQRPARKAAQKCRETLKTILQDDIAFLSAGSVVNC